MRLVRSAAAILAILLGAGAVFIVHTVWFKPWFIEHFYARVFIEFALDRPMLLSQLRILEPYGLDLHSDDLDDFSVDFALESAAKVRRNLEILRSYDRGTQSAAQLLSTDVLGWFLDLQARGEPFLLHTYPLNQLDGVQSALPDFLLNVHAIEDRRDARNYVVRLSRFGVALDQTLASVRIRAERGIVPPRFVVEHVIDEVEKFIALAPVENVLYTGLASKLSRLEDLSGDDREEILSAALRELEQTVYPAYERVLSVTKDLRGRASREDGVWRLPDGAAYYAWTLRFHTTTDLGADEIHRIGLEEVDRIHGEMRRILEAEGYDPSDLASTLQSLNREPRFLYPDTEEGRALVLADYGRIIDEVAERLPAYFGRLPRASARVERIPEFKEEGSPGAYYMPPAMDGSRPGIFYANLRSVAEIPRFGMRTLTFHEAIPGHHLQIAVAMELEDVPFFRRIVPFTAFTEGWALYAERLAAEEGFHPTPFDRLGQLIAEVFRAVRLVVDTGIHAKRWSREEAIAYMLRQTGMPRSDVVAEVERYIVNPGQACAYKVGQLRILALRDRARRVLGDRFDYREFHDVILGNGALPLALLEEVVDRWLEARRGSPDPPPAG